MSFLSQKMPLLCLALVMWGGVVRGGEDEPVDQLPQKLSRMLDRDGTLSFPRRCGISGLFHRKVSTLNKDQFFVCFKKGTQDTVRLMGKSETGRYKSELSSYFTTPAKVVLMLSSVDYGEETFNRRNGNDLRTWLESPTEPNQKSAFFSFAPDNTLLVAREGQTLGDIIWKQDREDLLHAGTYKKYEITYTPGQIIWHRVCAAALAGVSLVGTGIWYWLNNRD